MTEALRLGLMVPSGGTHAMYAPSFIATAELAAHEVNVAGGVLGREIELEHLRFGPNAMHSPDAIREQLAQVQLHGLICCHDSYVRELTLDVLAGGLPVYYPSLWEGGPQRAGVVCTGDSPGGQVWPAIAWLAENAAATDWFIVGTDYLWPVGTIRVIEPKLRQRGWWRGTQLLPYSFLDDLDRDERIVQQLVDAVESSGASCVLVLLHGSQMAMFNREFAKRGLDDRVLRFAPMADESVLMASGPEATRGLMTAFGRPADGNDFEQRYEALHGKSVPAPTGVTRASYEGVAVASALVRMSGVLSPSPEQLVAARQRGFEYQAPAGTVRVEGDRVTRPVTLVASDGINFLPIANLTGAPG